MTTPASDERARAAAVLAAVYSLQPDDVSEELDAREITLIADAVAQAVKEAEARAEYYAGFNVEAFNKQAEEIARLRTEVAQYQASTMEEALERAKCEDTIRELTFADDTGHSIKMSVAEWIAYWRNEAKAAVAAERALLADIEWNGPAGCCACCGRHREEGHNEICRLATALRAPTPEPNPVEDEG